MTWYDGPGRSVGIADCGDVYTVALQPAGHWTVYLERMPSRVWVGVRETRLDAQLLAQSTAAAIVAV